jgi:8-oxo-dGTP pyrophosphatase MutT (NUDIX family)
MPSWKKIKGKEVHKNPWYSVWEDDVIRPDGSKGKYYVIKKGPASLVIPLHKNKIYLVNQYRYPISKRTWEIPMGGADKDSGLKLAKKELLEETGFTAKKWKLLGNFTWTNGMSDHMGNVYLAENISVGDTELESTEKDMTMKAFSIKEIDEMIKRGQIIDSGTIVALYQLKLYKKLL